LDEAARLDDGVKLEINPYESVSAARRVVVVSSSREEKRTHLSSSSTHHKLASPW
jgi:hypothetical protein